MSTIKSLVSPDSEEFKENTGSYEDLLEQLRTLYSLLDGYYTEEAVSVLRLATIAPT